MSEENLKSLHSLHEIDKFFEDDSLVLVGFFLSKDDTKENNSLEMYIKKIFKDKNIRIYSGTSNDLEQADKKNQNLGIYMLNRYDLDDIEDLLEFYPELSSNEKLMEELEDRDDDDDEYDDDNED